MKEHMTKVPRATTFQTTSKERTSYAIYFLGQNALYGLVSGYLQIYMTGLGIAAVTVGFIFLGARIWDAVNDPLFGIIVDKSQLKGGKYKPWLKLSSYLLPIFTIAMFGIPSSMSVGLKSLLATVFYVCWGMSYTVCDIPIFSLVTAMTSNTQERTKIVAGGRTMVFVGALLASVAVPLMFPTVGWTITGIVVALVSFATMMPLGYIAKERNNLNLDQSPSLKELIQSVTKNKYLLMMLVSSVVSGLTNTSMVVGGYFAMYNLGNTNMMIYLSVLPLIPTIFLGVITPMLTKRFDKFHLYVVAMAGNFVFSVVVFLVGYSNLAVFLIFCTIRSVCFFFQGIIGHMFFLDCAEYGLYKTGKNATGVTMSLSTFSAKVLSAASGSLAMFILAAVGFLSGDVAAQPQAVTNMIWYMISFFPAIGQIVSLTILVFGYKLRDKDIQLIAKANQGEIDRKECERQLSKKIKAI